MPAIEAEASDIAGELTPTPGPKPPPSVSEKVELPFPPPAPPTKQTQDLAEEGPLKVLRTSPTEKAPGLVGSVTAVFNQPMVPLASIDDLKLERSPLTLEPLPPGKFRWLGTQMIAFEPEGRMPYSTTYTAKVVAGETSTMGTKLAKEVKWQFTTPSLAVESITPGDYESATLDTVVVLRFNQAIDRDKLLAAMRVKGGGGLVSVTQVAPEQWAGLPEPFRSYAQQGPAERVIVLRPAAALTANTAYTVEIPAGVYGEGPNPSKAIRLTFRTYPPLTLDGPRCSSQYYWDCNPQAGLHVSASNTLVSTPDAEKKVHVTPEVPDLKVTVAGDIHLTGKFRGLGTYTIEVEPGLKDIHGQELKAPYRKTVTLPPLDASLQWADRPVDPAVLEPSHSGVLEAKATGLTSVEVRARSFEPSEMRKILIDRHVRYDGEWPEPLKSPTWDKLFEVRESRVEAATLSLDTRALGAGAGRFLLLGARSNELGNGGWHYYQSLSQVVQITRLGVTAALDSDSGVILVTDIETGEPLPGVELGLHNMALDGPVWSGKSGPDGLAELTHGTMYDQPYILARYQGEAAYIPLQQTADNSWGVWMHANREDEPRIFFYSDRQPYKPGETVHMQGIVREETRGPAGKVQLARRHVRELHGHRPARPRGRQGRAEDRPVRHLQHRHPDPGRRRHRQLSVAGQLAERAVLERALVLPRVRGAAVPRARVRGQGRAIGRGAAALRRHAAGRHQGQLLPRRADGRGPGRLHAAAPGLAVPPAGQRERGVHLRPGRLGVVDVGRRRRLRRRRPLSRQGHRLPAAVRQRHAGAPGQRSDRRARPAVGEPPAGRGRDAVGREDAGAAGGAQVGGSAERVDLHARGQRHRREPASDRRPRDLRRPPRERVRRRAR
ncbi:Ig-like domain-containing protein [Nannocystis pusilla]|uniref:Ig-like domain-containing protein n=1 Tax=Nannocystis pusilla TaxID=889268 RepID=A0A9X3EM40_9BACT|nr:Ig-like domain-containing protein [Nannocystis pusilla]